jgi:hypothetical protein
VRWLVVGVLGLFHGAYFSIFLAESRYNAITFMCGVAATELLLIAAFAVILGSLIRFARLRRAIPIAASLLLITGVVWFFVRLKTS